MSPHKRYNIAVVGVGAVGEEMLRILSQRNFPIKELRVFARSSRDIVIDNQTYSVKEISPDGFKDIDIALFAGTEGEKGAAVTYAPEAIRGGSIIIDNGADFRLDPQVPLIVPEVNPQDIKWHKGLIASPNCSTIQMVVALWPIHKVAKIVRVIVCSYQAVSGAGRGAVQRLEQEVKDFCAGKDMQGVGGILPRQIAFNVFPHIGSFQDLNYTTEEWKTVRETQKIMHDEEMRISATTVRVPVKTGHSEAIYIETAERLEPEEAREILSESPGVKVIDDPRNNLYPTPIDAEGKDEVFVGRIRGDPFMEKGLWLWVVSDNLRKGAALNAIQIAEKLISNQ